MHDGVGALGAGLQARCVRLFLSQAIQFSIVDALVIWIKERQAQGQHDGQAPPNFGATHTPSRHPSTLAPSAPAAS